MATVSQTIPNYYGGISEQPDELKIPGQVKSLKNVLPDITHGLLKRPGGRLVGGNMTSYTGADKTKWFHYYRTEEEQYIGQIKLSDGSIKMWCLSDVINTAGQVVYAAGSEIDVIYEGCGYITITNAGSGYTSAPTVTLSNTSGSDGSGATATAEISEAGKVTKVTVTNAGKNYTGGVTVTIAAPSSGTTATATAISPTTEIKNYLKTTNSSSVIDPGDVQVLTLNDYTYITNRNKATAMRTDAASLAPSRPPEAYIELKKVAYASQYSINLFDDLTTTDIPTATRLTIPDALINSSNACYEGGSGNWKMPDAGNLPGSVTPTGICNKDDASDNDDDRMPNVGTKIFAITHGASGDPADANETAHTYDVTPVANTGAASLRKQLYFRLTVTGQPVSQSNEEKPIYNARYTVTHDLLYGGEGWREGDYFYVWMKNAKYKVTIAQDSIAKVQCNLGKIRPQPTSFDTKTAITAESILGSIRAGILGDSYEGTNDLYEWRQDPDNEYNVRQIGNGIYISRPSGQGTFGITTPVGELLNVFTSSVKDIADLPSQCKHGYIIKVANSTADEDDYYVQFIGNDGRDGEGVWEECPQQGRQVAFKEETMPISLIRTADFKFRATFIDGHKYTVTLSSGDVTYQPPSWADCGVGSYYPDTNSGTAMPPSFIGYGISKMLFFRNRMVMLSDENVIMSRPGKFFNFWPKTATTYTPSDNVDLSCSSEYPAIVYDGIQVNQGLLLFTKNQQFMLTTDSDVLSPNTAKINALCTYNFNSKTNPISLGTTIGFLDDGGKFSRFFEITSATREGQPEVLEQTKAVAKSFPNGINIIANSRENSVIFFAKQGENKIYGYRYFQSPRKRVLQSWFQWELSGKIQHLSMLDDVLYAVVRNHDIDVLQKFSIKIDNDTNTLIDDQDTLTDDSDDVTYRVHLDNATVIASTALVNPTGSPVYTPCPLPATGFNKSNIVGTYARSAGSSDLVVTTGSTVHEYEVGQVVYLDFTSGSGVDDDYTVTALGSTTTFTVIQYDKDANGEFELDSSGEKIPITTAISGSVTTNPLTGAIAIATGTDKTFHGKYARVSTELDGGTKRIKLPGNWKTYESGGSTITPANNIVVGYLFDMEVKFPTIYKQDQISEGAYRADIHSTLVVHRVKFSFGPLGVYRLIVKKTGKNTYEEDFEALNFDAYEANTISFEADKKVTLPIYEKNINLDLTLKSTHASPATLYSLSWEGDYTDGYYQRV